MAKEQPFIQLDKISKRYGKSVILDNINLNIPYGEIFGIIGKSGSGKSTMLNIVIGFLKPTEGRVYYQSHDIYNNLREIKEQFGFAAQEVSFYTRLSVAENLKYFGKMYNLNNKQLKERIPELLKLVNLTGNERLQGWKLSAGMQKRLDIACALIHEPKVLLLDEPTEDLDPALRFELLDLVKKINSEKNVTVILTSHLLNEVEYMCDRVAILHNHNIIASGKIIDIKNDYSRDNEIVVELQDRNNEEFIKMVRKISSVSKVKIRQGKIHVYTNKGSEILKSMLNISLQPKRKFNVTSITLSKPSLEEAFESLTSTKIAEEVPIEKSVKGEIIKKDAKKQEIKKQDTKENIFKNLARDDLRKLVSKVINREKKPLSKDEKEAKDIISKIAKQDSKKSKK